MTRDLSSLPTTSRFSAPDDHPGFDDLVAYLDSVERLGPFRVLQAAADERLDVQNGHSVLDLGCGLGRATREAARRAGVSGEAIGVDISNAILRIAKSRSETIPHPRYVFADAAKLPFPFGVFDRVRAERLLMHVQNPAEVLNEIKRVLLPGGLAVLIEPDWRSLKLAHADSDACKVLRSVFEVTIRHPSIGADLSGLCSAAGLSLIDVQIHEWSSTDFDEIDLTLQLDRVAEIAVRQGLYSGTAGTLTQSLRYGPLSASLPLTCLLASQNDWPTP